jgi:hypothetical protein
MLWRSREAAILPGRFQFSRQRLQVTTPSIQGVFLQVRYELQNTLPSRCSEYFDQTGKAQDQQETSGSEPVLGSRRTFRACQLVSWVASFAIERHVADRQPEAREVRVAGVRLELMGGHVRPSW